MGSIEESFIELVKIVAKLRNPNGGCPWDLEQTHASLKPFVIEEAFEVSEAIDEGPEKLSEELGDLLLQVVLHAQIASETKQFDIETVCRRISEKLVRRHPHVFGEVKVDGSQEVLKNWEQIKQKELSSGKSIVDGVPRGMPALLRAQRLGDKGARVGFDWPDIAGVREKVLEELKEFIAEAQTDPTHASEGYGHELGDLLFSLVQLARKSDLDAESLLHKANDRFTERFRLMETYSERPLKELNMKELDALWDRAKAEIKAKTKQPPSP